ncbi:MAG TPA: lipoate--protein ligase family protein [Candidatus Omnitrophota bacterium]|nr:lipoate--protein ligase family protein [Candidatus Omnitrophota bacterium]
MKLFRLIRSGALSAASNMALDEKIYKGYLEDGVGVLRLYQWQGPSFTYGFSQEPQNQLDLAACSIDGVEVVKRITGGGILFHDDEITYSFVCSKSDVGEPQKFFVDYRNICQFLLRFYKSLGLNPGFALEGADFRNKNAPHELCSAAHEKYDIIIGARKIGGNAQKRNRQTIFQHGSIPCRINWGILRKYIKSVPDDLAAGLTTLSDELKVLPEKEVLEEKLIEAFAHTFNINFLNYRQPDAETQNLASLQNN